MAEKRNNKEQREMKDTKKLSSTGSSNGKCSFYKTAEPLSPIYRNLETYMVLIGLWYTSEQGRLIL